MVGAMTIAPLPATWKFDYPVVHAQSRAEWRQWLTDNSDAERGVWLCSWRSSVEGPRCEYVDAVEEAICFGWIDSTITIFDETRALQLYSKRKGKSSWTRLNRKRAADMEERGLMTDAGRAAISVAKGNGWWTILDSVEDLDEGPELRAALDASPRARRAWDAFPPSARKQMLFWVVTAVQGATRSQRISQIVTAAAEGRRARG